MKNHHHNTTFRILGVLALGLLLACGNSNNATSQQQTTAHQVQEGANQAANPSTAQPAQPTATPEPAQAIPNFTFYILKSGIRFTKEDLAKEGNIVFIFFDPTCIHCQHEARDLGKHHEQLTDVNFYFVSMNDPALMSAFLKTHAPTLADKPNVEVLYDRNAEFINKFHIPSQFPATYVYGANNVLKQYWNGERNIEEIISAIKN